MWFDLDKAVEVLLYIAQSIDHIEQLLVAIYVADKMHLERYGRLIYGETYVTAFCGVRPVQMQSVIAVMGAEIATRTAGGKRIVSFRKPNTDLLSESDIRCLEGAIQECMDDWRTKSRDAIFVEDVTKLVTYEDIAKTLPNAELLLEYLRYE